MFLEMVIAWVTLGILAYIFAMFGMDRIYGEYQQDLLTLEKKIKNPKNCPLCKQNLTTWFSQCVSCSSCDIRTCRSCADYNLLVGEWTCQKCVYRRNNKGASFEDSVCRTSSKYWYDDILPRKGSLAQFSVSLDTHVDRTTLARYDQLEQFVSRHLHITPAVLNGTDVGKTYRNRGYELIFSRYQAVISLELTELLGYLKSADQVKEAVSLRKLKELMDKVKIAAKLDLPTNMEAPVRNKGNGIKSYAPTYPDILSTAILNRIIIDGQGKSPNCSISPVSNDSAVVADYSSTSTELPESGSEKDTHNWVLSSTTEAALALRTSDEESVVETPGGEHSGSDWSTENTSTPQAQLKILEESIEEITTTTYESDGSSEDDGTISSHSDDDAERHFDGSLSPRKAIQQNIANWEHNWLFKRKKELLRKRQKLLEDPVTMLVPNPTEEVEVMIGDEKASDMEDDIDSLDVTELGYVIVERDDVDRTSDIETNVAHVDELNIEEIKTKPDTPSVGKTPVPTPRVTVPAATAATPVSDVQKVEIATVATVTEIPPPSTPNLPSTPEIHHPRAQASEESLYETNHALSSNETILLPTEIPESKANLTSSSSSSSDSEVEPPALPPPMRIAEREKEKWNHPVEVKYNPYAVENLNKRLKEKEFIYFPSAKSRDDAELSMEAEKTDNFPVENRSLDKFRRDYYVPQSSSSAEERKHSTSSSSSDGDFSKVTMETVTKIEIPIPQPNPVVSSPTPVPSPRRTEVVSASKISDSSADLDEIKLPSVRSLAKKFSSPAPEVKPLPKEVVTPRANIWKPTVVTGPNPGVKQQFEPKPVRASKEANIYVRDELGQVVAVQLASDANDDSADDASQNLISFDDSSQSLMSFDDDTAASSCPSEAIRETSSSSSEEDVSRLPPKNPEPSSSSPSSLYHQFSRSKSEPPMGSTSPIEEEIPWKSTRQLILELERKAQSSLKTSPFPVKRTQSVGVKPVRVGAMEHFAHQPITGPPIQEIVDDPDLKLLKRAIVRGSRTRKGLSQDKEKELTRQDAIDTARVQD